MHTLRIYLIEMWIPKEGKEKECYEVSREILRYIKERREMFKEGRSHRLFRVLIGGRKWFIDVQEYDDLRSMEELGKRIIGDEEYIKLIKRWKECVNSRKTRSLILYDVHRDLWIE